MNNVRASKYGHIFRPDSFVFGQTGAGKKMFCIFKNTIDEETIGQKDFTLKALN